MADRVLCQELATPGTHYRRPKSGMASPNMGYANGGGSWRAAPRHTQKQQHQQQQRQTTPQQYGNSPGTGTTSGGGGRYVGKSTAEEPQPVESTGAEVVAGLPATPRTTKQTRNKSEGGLRDTTSCAIEMSNL